MTPEEEAAARRKGLLSVLFCAGCWLGPPALFVLNAIGVGLPHGGGGVCLSLGASGSLLAVSSFLQRMCILAIPLRMAATAPPGRQRVVAALCAGSLTVMAWLAKGGRFGKQDFAPRPWIYKFICDWPKYYYRRVELRGELDDACSKGKCCFAFHPHGCLSQGFTYNGMYHPGFWKAGRVNYMIDANLRYINPAFRWLMDAVQSDTLRVRDARRKTVLDVMATGENISLLPGGFQEAVAFEHGKHCIVMKHRKGLIKYCLQFGYRIFPIYTFGETSTYYTVTWFRKLRMKISLYNIPMVMFFGWPLIPFLPLRDSRIMTYIGASLDLPHIEEPTAEDVDLWHGRYLEALRRLFEEKREEAGFPGAELEIC